MFLFMAPVTNATLVDDDVGITAFQVDVDVGTTNVLDNIYIENPGVLTNRTAMDAAILIEGLKEEAVLSCDNSNLLLSSGGDVTLKIPIHRQYFNTSNDNHIIGNWNQLVGLYHLKFPLNNVEVTYRSSEDRFS
jgi:hypothetical protein